MKKVDPELYHRDPVPEDADLRLRYLGTAGFVVEGAGRVIVIDPFVTRPSLTQTAFGRLTPNVELIKSVIPKADDVLIGHAHHDHVLDGPDLCKQTGARFIGSPSACNVARAAGLPEAQIRETRGREDIACGEAVVRGLPSRHGKVYFGRIPLTGDIPKPPSWPPRYNKLRHGLVLNWHLDIAGLKMFHVDSADFIEEEMEGMKADILCLCAIGRKYRDNYTETAIKMLEPKIVIACHWDWFFSPYHKEPSLLPAVDLPGFLDEIRQAGSTPVVLPMEGSFGMKAG